MILLQVRGLKKQFGGLLAIDDLNFNVEQGEILGLVGPNGAGKTTAFNTITGVYAPAAGRVEFKGEDITGLRPSKIAERGITRTWQVSALFANMTVLQSVVVGCHLVGKISFWQAIAGGASARKKGKDVQEKAAKVLDFTGLTGSRDMLCKHLPLGFQRRLGIAIALGADAALLLLDEPLAGMNPQEIQEATALIQEINKKGITILLVEHNMRAVMSICDRIVALQYGRKIAEGLPQEIAQDQGVIRAYLGGGAGVAGT